MRLGNGLADMRAMLERRVNVGIGTDGANCSDNLNMYEAMRLASFASKAQRPDAERWVTTEEVALAATEGSARALGFEGRLGRLAPGHLADVVFLDLGHPNWIPLNDPTNQLVHTEDGAAVRHVMVGGRMIVENRRVTTVDVAALAREAEAARQRLARVNAPGRALYERLAPIVGRYCPGLAHTPYHITRYVGGA
jgi:5-methylthioadenosine/S-adenosylhomocysteine deaminase